MIACTARAEGSSEATLLALAQKHFGKPENGSFTLLPADERLFTSVASGSLADFIKEPDKDRVIQADRISWLCTDPEASRRVTVRGINVAGARIDGMLDLAWATATYPISISNSVFTENIILSHCHLRSLELRSTKIKGLEANALTVDQNLDLSQGFSAEGEVGLKNATIGGQLDCHGGQFINEAGEAPAIDAENIKVGGSVFLSDGFNAVGEVSLIDASIGVALNCGGGQFHNKEGKTPAIDADSVKVGNSVFLRYGFKAEGQVNLLGATIGFNLDCNGGQFINPGKEALDAGSVKVGGNAFLNNGFNAEGEVFLIAATIGGDLDCNGGHFMNKGADTPALEADNIKVEQGVQLNSTAGAGGEADTFRAEGAVDLGNATIGGQLSCNDGQFINPGKEALNASTAKIGTNAMLDGNFRAEGAVDLGNAIIGGQLSCNDGQFINPGKQALNASSARIGTSAILNGKFRAEGEVLFNSATIGGHLVCNGGHFMNKGADTPALEADNIKVEQGVLLNSTAGAGGEADTFRAEGAVDLGNATIGGQLSCNDGQFINPGKEALNASTAKIGTNAMLDGNFRAEGAVDLGTATIGGQLACNDGQFINPGKQALNASSARVGSHVFLNGKFRAEGEVLLIGATIGGQLACNGGHFSNKGADTPALEADNIKVEQGVLLNSTPGAGGEADTFKAEGAVDLGNATIGGQLSCNDGQFINPGKEALNASTAKIGTNVMLDGKFRADGAVDLGNATIRGQLACDDGQFINPGKQALNANSAKVGSHVFLNGKFRAEGEVSLIGATIGGQLACNGGHFMNRGAYTPAFEANNIKVEQGVLLNNTAGPDGRAGTFRAEGAVDLSSATIGGSLYCGGGQFINPDGIALDGSRARIQGSAQFSDEFEAAGTVDFQFANIGGDLQWYGRKPSQDVTLNLQSARVKTLRDDEPSWPAPGHLVLQGFVYDEIYSGQSSMDAPTGGERLKWLGMQKRSIFISQPYEQLAGVLRKMGSDDDAVDVMIAKNSDQARYTKFPSASWWWYNCFGRIIGYGYDPRGAFITSLALIAIGAVLFALGDRKGCIIPKANDAYVVDGAGVRTLRENCPGFSPLVYSFESFVPLLALGQDEFWMPSADPSRRFLIPLFHWPVTGNMLRYYHWILVVSGWILSTLLLGQLTGLMKT